MSKERFDWLEQWAKNPEDIIRTPGTESNVKEIYDMIADEYAGDFDAVSAGEFFANISAPSAPVSFRT